MVLKVHFNDDEIRRFFELNGFKIVDHKVGRFVPTYHNRDEWEEFTVPGVVVDGRTYEASKVFEQVAEMRVKQMVAPANLETRRNIERATRKFNK